MVVYNEEEVRSTMIFSLLNFLCIHLELGEYNRRFAINGENIY
jgi:hypothetical protein